ncbi:hypothetical protein [Streptomyces xylophagus]|uniref:hypothetical protein n=1 Tax=Streptomyces xylophagus TaxID=285514 RepID=UPI00131B4D7C|nr:hypothetical protein [Streptomyces xylophagus]
MTHRLAQLRSPVALLTCCALLFAALAGVLAFSGRASAATDLGKLTVAPATGNIADIPMTTSVTTSSGCNATTAQTVVLRLVNPTTPTSSLPLAQSSTKTGVGADPFTVALQATAAKPSLQSVLTSSGVSAPYDGTYTVILTCGTSATADRFLAKIRVTGTIWTLLEQQATTLAVSAPFGVSVGGDLKLTATVTPASAAGSVEFKNGDTSLGTAQATNGTAELTLKAPAIGGPLPFSAVFTPTDADAYSGAEATGSADIGYVVSAKDADGNALAANPTLAIGQKVKVTVKGFTPAAAAHVTLSGSTATYPDVTVNADGAVADYAFTVPDQLPNGDHALQFSEKTGVYASLPFVSTDAATSSPSPTVTENPDLTVTDEDGNDLGTNPALDAGQKVKITARGYTASATVKVTLADSDATFADATANSAGTVDSYAFTVPSDIADGDHTLTLAEDKTDGHSVAFAFTTGSDDSSDSPSPSASDTESGATPTDGSTSGGSDTGGTTGGDSGTGTGTGSMAATGTQIGAIGLASLAFLAAGSALVLHMRRKGLLTFGNGDTPQHR